jgi:putative oligomerization/nucleic acid binding protein
MTAAQPSVGALSRRRRVLIWALIVTASLLGLVSVLTMWVQRQMLDNRSWEKASTQVIEDAQVRTALSAYLVNQLYDQVNVERAIEQRLPANLKELAGPLSSALRQPATSTAEFILARPRVQQLWITSTTIAHQKLVNVLENKTGYGISTGNGAVTVNLHGLVTELGADLGLPAAALEKVPADAGVITVMKSDQLAAAQTGVRVIKVLSAWLLVLVLALYALAIYLARGARRATLRNVGWAFVIVGLIVLVIRRVVGNYALDALASPTYRGTIHDVWLIGTAILGETGAATVMYGLVTVAGAALAGPTKAAVAARRRLAPLLDRHLGLCAAGLATAYLLLILWGPTYALRTWWGVLLFAALLAAGVAALRRQTRAEFAGAGGQSLTGSLLDRLPTKKEPASTAEEIARLAGLRAEGVISDDEFARAKKLALS